LVNSGFSGTLKRDFSAGYFLSLERNKLTLNIKYTMKRKLLYLLSIALLASCSAPKYTYNFSHYNYPTAKKTESASVSSQELVASINDEPAMLSKPVVVTEDLVVVEKKEGVQASSPVNQLTKKQIKKEIKQMRSLKKANSIESNQQTKAIDNDLKLAAIFGAVGLVALIIGGQVFWIIGGIAMIIGVVFFIKWLLRQ
jgi:uncharacterized membrane protein